MSNGVNEYMRQRSVEKVLKKIRKASSSPEKSTIRVPRGIRLEVHMKAAYDKRHSEPGKNYGIHGVHVFMAYIGKSKAAVFDFSTPMHLPHVTDELVRKATSEIDFAGIIMRPMGFNVAVHTTKPQYRGQEEGGKCSILGTQKCYCDSSPVAAAKMMDTLLAEGSDGVWRKLKEVYEEAV